MTFLEELKEKRKSALIMVCTLGLAALFDSKIRKVWMSNLFEGTSLDEGIMGTFLKTLSYSTLAIIVASIIFVISVVRVIYYSIEISRNS